MTQKEEEEDSTLIHRKTTDDTVNEDQEKSKKKTDKGCESDEVLAVLCHEFGHWSLNHNIINLGISFVCIKIIECTFHYNLILID
jgi:STE24 endopeptidase